MLEKLDYAYERNPNGIVAIAIFCILFPIGTLVLSTMGFLVFNWPLNLGNIVGVPVLIAAQIGIGLSLERKSRPDRWPPVCGYCEDEIDITHPDFKLHRKCPKCNTRVRA